MGVYRDNLSSIVIDGNNQIISTDYRYSAQNRFVLSLTDIAFAIYFVIADKLLR